jgi:chromosome segregation ATPase
MANLKRTLFGYSSASVRSELSERDAVLDRTSRNASAAEQRAERLSSELSETQSRLAGLEEQLDAAQELSASLTADLERSVAQRDSIEAEVQPLRLELQEVRIELSDAKEAVLGKEEQLREAQGSLRALEESGGPEAAFGAQQRRVAELEELVEGYRELIEGGSATATPSAQPSNGQEPYAGPSTAGELAAVIEAAEQAVASILQSTRVRADEELRAVDAQRERIKHDVEAMTAWRDRAAPMIVSLQAAIREMQGQAAEIGLRVDEALRPVSTAVTALTTQLASLDDLAVAPLDVSSETPAPSRPDLVTRLPEEHLASRDWDG